MRRDRTTSRLVPFSVSCRPPGKSHAECFGDAPRYSVGPGPQVPRIVDLQGPRSWKGGRPADRAVYFQSRAGSESGCAAYRNDGKAAGWSRGKQKGSERDAFTTAPSRLSQSNGARAGWERALRTFIPVGAAAVTWGVPSRAPDLESARASISRSGRARTAATLKSAYQCPTRIIGTPGFSSRAIWVPEPCPRRGDQGLARQVRRTCVLTARCSSRRSNATLSATSDL
jgi:hypothetical protein